MQHFNVRRFLLWCQQRQDYTSMHRAHCCRQNNFFLLIHACCKNFQNVSEMSMSLLKEDFKLYSEVRFLIVQYVSGPRRDCPIV